MRNGIFTVLAACFIGAMLAFSGCAAQLTPQQAQGMTPDQIEAYQKMGQKVIACAQAGGPPPIGAGSFLIVPATATGAVVFGSDCHPKDGTTIQLGK